MNFIELNRFTELQQNGCLIIDTRPAELFCEGHIVDALSVPFSDTFVTSITELTEQDQKIMLVAEETEIAAIEKRLKESGIDTIEGFLQGGFEAWKNNGHKMDMLIAIDADEFAMDYHYDEFYLVDVRTKEEFTKEHAEDAENIELSDLDQIILELDNTESYYVYAQTSNEAVTAGSIFKRAGFNRIRVVAASYSEIKSSGVPVFVQKTKDKQNRLPNG